MDTLHKLLAKMDIEVRRYSHPDRPETTIHYITEPGIFKLKETRFTEGVGEILSVLGVNQTDIPCNQSAEFNSRLCYLQSANPTKPNTLVQCMIHKYGHLSVFGDWSVSLLIIGLSDECLKELLAHHEIHTSRLTSSKCMAQHDWSNLIFRVNGADDHQIETQLKGLSFAMHSLQHAKLKGNFEGLTTEQVNNLVPASKVSACVATASIKDWHKFIIGRFPSSGNEYQIRDLAHCLAVYFRSEYPGSIFPSMEEYAKMTNKDKPS
jgi:hypothetical protein